MWSVVVALPAVQAEFGVARGAASLPYTITMIGFGIASIFMGRLADRVGISSRLSSARCDDNAIHANARIADRVCRFYLQSRTEVAVQNGRNVE